MKKFVVMFLVMCFSLSAAVAIDDKDCKKRGTLVVNTSEYKELEPDTAELSIRIETTDFKSVQRASEDNKQIAEKVYTELKDLINTSNGDFIKTSNYNAAPLYKNSGNKSIFDRYRVTNNINIRTKNIDKVGEMIDKALNAGATSVHNLTFSISTYDKECEALLSAAGKKAYAQAQATLKQSNSYVEAVSSMNISCGGNASFAPRRMNVAAKGMTEEDAIAEASYTLIEPGVSRINANVNAVFFVKP